MSRTELLQQLRLKYPLGKAAYIVQMATGNGVFENEDVAITITKEQSDSYYQCNVNWK